MNNKNLIHYCMALILAFGVGWVNAHPDLKMSEDTTNFEAPIDADMNHGHDVGYYYDLYAKIVYEAPIPLQSEMIDQMVRMYVFQKPWSNKANQDQLLAEVEETYSQLSNYFYCVKLSLQDNAVTADDVKPLELTAELERGVLIEITNTGKTEAAVNVFSQRNISPPVSAITIAPGQSRTFLMVFLVSGQDALSALPIKIVNANNALIGSTEMPVQIVNPALIRGTLKEADEGGLFPGRVYVYGSDHQYRHGRAFQDNQTLSEKPIVMNVSIGNNYRLPFFYSDGTFEVTVPPGKVDLILQRGYEHKIVKQQVDVKSGQVLDVTLTSGRFIDMKAKGWYSGDTHVHWVKNWWSENEDIELLAMVQRAEDLRVANNLTLLQYRPESQGGNFIAPSQFPMGPVPGFCGEDYHIQMAEEYRNDNFYGHLNFLNIKKLIEPISTGPGSGGQPDAMDYPLNKTAIEDCHAQGGISIEAHNLGPFNLSDVPANVISGLSDSLDQLDPEHYYRFLDCGIQVPLTNGSDHPARLVGQCRAYVKVAGGFTYQKWIDGICAKCTFTTSGPLLFFTVNGKDIGSELNVKKGTELKIHAKAFSRFPLGNFQIVTNQGEILTQTSTQETSSELMVEIPAEHSGWFVARCSQTDEYSALKGANIAHTSAVYVTVDEKPMCRPEAVTYWIELLRRHAENVKANANYANDQQRQEELDYILHAIEKYQSRLKQVGDSN